MFIIVIFIFFKTIFEEMCQKIIAKTIITEKTIAPFSVKNAEINLVKNNDKIKLNAFLFFYISIVLFITRFVLNCLLFNFSNLNYFTHENTTCCLHTPTNAFLLRISPPVCQPNERIMFV